MPRVVCTHQWSTCTSTTSSARVKSPFRVNFGAPSSQCIPISGRSFVHHKLLSSVSMSAAMNGVGGSNGGPGSQWRGGDAENNQPSGEFEQKQRKNSTGLSQQARQVFQEAQENILALNRSRLRALEELKIANEKIADLETRLEEATRHITHLTGSRPASSDLSPHTQQTHSQDVQMNKGVTIVYETGWDDAFLHFKSDGSGGAWTQLPGLKLESQTGDARFAGKKIVTLPNCGNVEFVLTNGLGKFDSPNPYGEPEKPKNYVITSPGVYELRDGQLHRL